MDDLISRQAVLDLLEDTNNGWIINEVSQLPSVKPQTDCNTCDKAVRNRVGVIGCAKFDSKPTVAIPSATGHWIAIENEEMETIGYYCSKCDLPMETEEQTDYCPNCGAKMVEPQEVRNK